MAKEGRQFASPRLRGEGSAFGRTSGAKRSGGEGASPEEAPGPSCRASFSPPPPHPRPLRRLAASASRVFPARAPKNGPRVDPRSGGPLPASGERRRARRSIRRSPPPPNALTRGPRRAGLFTIWLQRWPANGIALRREETPWRRSGSASSCTASPAAWVTTSISCARSARSATRAASLLPNGDQRHARPDPGRPQRREGRRDRQAARHRPHDDRSRRRACATKDDTLFFDAGSTQMRAGLLRKAIARRQARLLREAGRGQPRGGPGGRAELAEARGVKTGVVQDKLYLPGLRKLAHAERHRLLRPHPVGARRVRLLGLRGRLAGGAAAELELPQGRRRRHHPRHALPLALRARQPLRRGEGGELPRRHPYPASASTKPASPTRPTPTMPPTPPSSSKAASSRTSIRPGACACGATTSSSSRSTARTARRSPASPAASRQHRVNTPRPVWNPDQPQAIDFYTTNGTRCPTTRSTTTASRCSGRSSSAIVAGTARGGSISSRAQGRAARRARLSRAGRTALARRPAAPPRTRAEVGGLTMASRQPADRRRPRRALRDPQRSACRGRRTARRPRFNRIAYRRRPCRRRSARRQRSLARRGDRLGADHRLPPLSLGPRPRRRRGDGHRAARHGPRLARRARELIRRSLDAAQGRGPAR